MNQKRKWLSNICLAFVSLLLSMRIFAQNGCPILPTPSSYVEAEGKLEIIGTIAINEAGIPEPIRKYLLKRCIDEFKLITVFTPVTDQVVFRKLVNVPRDYYSIRIDKGIAIEYSSEVSCFYALTSLFQLMEEQDGKLIFQKCFVSDAPKYEWRGLHLDVSRHFFSVDEVKRYIDLMALYKFNFFHWHLTDDQGWRVEIKKYPKLTEIGAWRDSTVNNHYTTIPRTYTNERYGGFYTQEEISDVVRYAAAKYITIVPEIEMPGHSRAAIAAYPQLSCTGEQMEVPGLWGVFDDILCTHETTIQFMEDVLDEVIKLFPSKYIHIGGDEAPKTRWKKCKKCQAVIRENGLKDEQELHSWFIGKIDDYLSSKGRILIGWDEILEGGLSTNAVVMSWRGTEGGLEAAKHGHNSVMSPGAYCYFDHYQSKDPNEPLAIGGYTPIEKVYNFDPVPSGTSPDLAAFILGGQANLWTEYIPNMAQLEYMLFPRAIALSQSLWCLNKPEYESFKSSLFNYHLNKLDQMNVGYSRAIFYPEMQLFQKNNAVVIVFKSDEKNEMLDLIISSPSEALQKMQVSERDTLFLNSTSGKNEIQYVYSVQSKHLTKSFSYPLTAHPSLALPIELETKPDERYAGDGSFTLTNGIRGSLPWKGNEWLGFDDLSIQMNIELKKKTMISGFKLGFLNDSSSWIYFPKEVKVLASKNGKKWRSVGVFSAESFVKNDLHADFEVKANFLKIDIITDKIPEGQPGAGNVPWTFMDEIILNYE